MHPPALFKGWERKCLCLCPKKDFGKDVPTEICMCLLFAEDTYTWKFSEGDSIFSLKFTEVFSQVKVRKHSFCFAERLVIILGAREIYV